MFRFNSLFSSLFIFLFLLMMSGMAHATLTTIGTAGYDSDGSGVIGADEWYNLIWDDDNNGKSVVWLDYTNSSTAWENQVAWAASLDGALTINLYAGYTIEWDGSWRLPTTVDAVNGTSTGYHITSSELGHLFYVELGNLGVLDPSGDSQSEYGLSETGDFEKLIGLPYWSGTGRYSYPDSAWLFSMYSGFQGTQFKTIDFSGLALRTGQVSMVPIPGTVWLFGLGLMSVLGWRKNWSRN